MYRGYVRASAVLFPVVWAGMIIGVSFIATPAKFLAPSLGMRTALDVGRSTFAVFNNIELFLVIGVVAIALLRKSGLISNFVVLVLLALVALQQFALLPTLDARINSIIAGYGVAPSKLHIVYVLTEVAKVFTLLVLGLRWTVDEFVRFDRSQHSHRLSRRIS